MILTDAQRQVFADYLRQSIAATKLLLEQAEKLPLAVSGMAVARQKLEQLAEQLVLDKLESTTSCTPESAPAADKAPDAAAQPADRYCPVCGDYLSGRCSCEISYG